MKLELCSPTERYLRGLRLYTWKTWWTKIISPFCLKIRCFERDKHCNHQPPCVCAQPLRNHQNGWGLNCNKSHTVDGAEILHQTDGISTQTKSWDVDHWTVFNWWFGFHNHISENTELGSDDPSDHLSMDWFWNYKETKPCVFLFHHELQGFPVKKIRYTIPMILSFLLMWWLDCPNCCPILIAIHTGFSSTLMRVGGYMWLLIGLWPGKVTLTMWLTCDSPY